MNPEITKSTLNTTIEKSLLFSWTVKKVQISGRGQSELSSIQDAENDKVASKTSKKQEQHPNYHLSIAEKSTNPFTVICS